MIVVMWGKLLCHNWPLIDITEILHRKLTESEGLLRTGQDHNILQHETEYTPHDLQSDCEILMNLRVCDKYYGSLPSRGHNHADHVVMASKVSEDNLLHSDILTR